MYSFKQKVKELKNKITNFDNYNKIITKKNQLLDWVEVHPWKILTILFCSFIIIKFFIVQLTVGPTSPGDGCYYMQMARSFLYDHDFLVHGAPSHQYPPIYPILISPAFLFSDMIDVHSTIMLINVIISSTIIFPIYFLSKEFLNTKYSLFISIIISLMPFSMAMPFLVFSENLFYIMFISTIYFLYKSLTTEKFKYIFLSGIFIGFTFLTRYLAIILIPTVVIVFLIYYYYINKNERKIIRMKKSIKKSFYSLPLILSFSGIIVLPWLIRNAIHFGYSVNGIMGYTMEIESASHTASKLVSIFQPSQSIVNENLEYWTSIFIQFLVHNGALILSCGVLFVIVSIYFFYISYKNYEKNYVAFGLLMFVAIEILILLTAWHNSPRNWRLLLRYSEPVYPLFIIFGFCGMIYIKRFSYKVIYLVLILFIPFTTLAYGDGRIGSNATSIANLLSIKGISSYLGYFGLNIPVNDGIIIVIQIIILIVIILLISFLLLKSKKKMVLFFAFLLIFSSTIIASGAYITRENIIKNSDIYKAGAKLNKEVSGKKYVVLYDEKMEWSIISYHGLIPYFYLVSWTNAETRTGDINISDLINYSTSNIGFIVTFNKLDIDPLFNITISDPLATSLEWRENWSSELYVYDIRNQKFKD